MALQQTLISQIHLKSAKERQHSFSFLAALVIGILLGFIAFINVNITFWYYFIKGLQVVLFFAFGNLYISLGPNIITLQRDGNPRNRILLISVLFCIVLSTLYFLLRKDVMMMAFSCSAAFLLPFFLKYSWVLFTKIPDKEFNTWFPSKKTPDKPPVSLDSLLVRLKIKQHVSDADEKMYTVFVPHYLRLGDFFSRFLAEHNAHAASSIEHIDAKENTYAWEFFLTGFYGLQLKRLDPGLTMAENKIKKDTVVYIKRLKQPVKYHLIKKTC